MNNNAPLTSKQWRVIPHLLAAPSIEEACRRAKINKTTVYEWLKNDTFRQALKTARDELIERALDGLKASIGRAVETLVELLESQSGPIKIRAAENIIQFVQKAIEADVLEKRVQALEERLR
jgi:AcrR family transcriptional regulator